MRCRTARRDQSPNPLKTANLIIAYGLIVNSNIKKKKKLIANNEQNNPANICKPTIDRRMP
jgi:hypothetical protein